MQVLSYGDGVWQRSLNDFHVIGSSVPNPPPAANLSLKNYPNPFSNQTTISFSTLDREFVDIRIVNLLGAECSHLFSGSLDAGEHSFDWNGALAPVGVYFCVVRSAGGEENIPIIKE